MKTLFGKPVVSAIPWIRQREVAEVVSGDGRVRFLCLLCDSNSSVMSWKLPQVSQPLASDDVFQLKGMVVCLPVAGRCSRGTLGWSLGDYRNTELGASHQVVRELSGVW